MTNKLILVAIDDEFSIELVRDGITEVETNSSTEEEARQLADMHFGEGNYTIEYL